MAGLTAEVSAPEGARNLRAPSSQRCSSFGFPSTRSVMWKVAGFSHFWHFIVVTVAARTLARRNGLFSMVSATDDPKQLASAPKKFDTARGILAVGTLVSR